MGECEHRATGGPPPADGPDAPRGKLRWAALTLGVALLAAAGWTTVTSKWPWSGLPDRACWGSVDSALLSTAADAARADGSWKVEEDKDTWDDPSCKVSRGDWNVEATVMKTPLKSHLWWGTGRFPLPRNLPGMVHVHGDRVDGWLHLPQCGNRMVNVNVPGAERDRRAAADLAARLLLAVGNARAGSCGGKPFPEPPSLDWPALKSVPLAPGAKPCGLSGDLRPSRRETSGSSQTGSLGDGVISRCGWSRGSSGEEDGTMSDIAALVLRDRSIVDAFSPTGIRAVVKVTPGRPLSLSREDLRYDRDGVTALVCAEDDGTDRRYVHVFASGSDAQYAAAKRAVLHKVAALMRCG
ncbi:hypothetical protein ACFYVL_21335 [Streptomyces sp. NPDC004111]|uniref:hypothetical protein n=1 Tax=Streptomyces sp. NPDC004111 TaxID=3364690 RepID=UPI003674DD84